MPRCIEWPRHFFALPLAPSKVSMPLALASWMSMARILPGSVVLAFSLRVWRAPGFSVQLSPAL